MKKTLSLYLLCLFSLCVFFSTFNPQSSILNVQAKAKFSISPVYKSNTQSPWLVYDAHPSEIISDQIKVQNLSDQEGVFNIYPSDAYTKNGGFIIENQEQTRDHIGKWIQINENKVRLKPKEEKIIDIILTIPEEIEEKKYSGAILIQQESNTNVKKSGAIISTRVGLRTYVTVKQKPVIMENTPAKTVQTNDQKALSVQNTLLILLLIVIVVITSIKKDQIKKYLKELHESIKCCMENKKKIQERSNKLSKDHKLEEKIKKIFDTDNQ